MDPRQLLTKSSKAFLSFMGVRTAKLTTQNYVQYAEQGYSKNPYVFACIDKIVQSAKNIDIELFDVAKDGTEKKLVSHDVLDIMEKPNPFYSFDDMLEAYIVFMILDGNNYIEKVKVGKDVQGKGGKTKQLYYLRPDKIDIVYETDQIIKKFKPIKRFEYKNGGTINFDPEELIHTKNFNPLDEAAGLGKGQPRMAPIAPSGDMNNEGRLWNIALLQNSAVPSGVVEADPAAQEVTATVVKKIRARFREFFQGSKNAGEPLILQYAKWKQMSMTNKDLDWSEGIQQSGREICEGLGVPSILVGDPSAKTFNNYKEAKEALYIDTVIPYVVKFLHSLNVGWVKDEHGTNLGLRINKDSIEVLRDKRMALWDKVDKATFLKESEKRMMLGIESDDPALEGYLWPANLMFVPAGETFEDDDDEE